MAVFKRAARAVGKVNENLQRLRNHRASLTTDGQQGGGTDEDDAEAVRNDIKKHARRAHFHVKGLQDAMAAELVRLLAVVFCVNQRMKHLTVLFIGSPASPMLCARLIALFL